MTGNRLNVHLEENPGGSSGHHVALNGNLYLTDWNDNVIQNLIDHRWQKDEDVIDTLLYRATLDSDG
ncbi:hypothetical protein FRX31_034569 [Thalictrum thalictroides]|uniref:Uncharacterized protein n=1 Tax=Thalictrum thalictroides TaxID=46969 RepID=A0A7J6UTQ8_THATH|nr:hypothetical protein FRX31_034569 [Thalictrum thalictroides]